MCSELHSNECLGSQDLMIIDYIDNHQSTYYLMIDSWYFLYVYVYCLWLVKSNILNTDTYVKRTL